MDLLALLFFWIPLAGGLVVWAEICRRWYRGEEILKAATTDRVRSHPGVAVAAGVWIALHLLLRLAEEFGFPPDADGVTRVTVEDVQFSVWMNFILVAVFLLALSEAGRRPLGRYGLHLRRLKGDAAAAALGFLASLPPVALVFWATQIFRAEETLHPFVRLMQGEGERSAEVALWVFVAVVVAAPLAEELLYRVVLQGTLRRRLSAGWSIGIAGTVFAGVHGFPDSLALLPLGIILGYVFEKRQSYAAVVLLHALFNLRTLLQMLTGSGG